MEKHVLYRLEVNYYSRNYDDKMLETSSPIYSLDEGIRQYMEAIKEKCVDNPEQPARTHLWEYVWSGKPFYSECTEKTIMKNY